MVLPLMPVFFVFRTYFEARLRAASDDAQHQSSLESSFLQEHLTSIIQIQLLYQARNQTRAFIERAAAKLRAINHRSLIEILFSTSYMAVIALGTIAILGYGGHPVVCGGFTIWGLRSFFSFIAELLVP